MYICVCMYIYIYMYEYEIRYERVQIHIETDLAYIYIYIHIYTYLYRYIDLYSRDVQWGEGASENQVVNKKPSPPEHIKQLFENLECRCWISSDFEWIPQIIFENVQNYCPLFKRMIPSK